MTILDVNVLIYAYNPHAPQNHAAASWLNDLLNSSELIGLPWPTIWAFLRLGTDRNLRVRPGPNIIGNAVEKLRDWLAQPGVILVQPGPRHLELLERLVIEGQAAGPLLSDATLAALALENGATLASTDRDFSRFPGLRWINPLA